MHCAGETLPAPCYLASDRKQSASALYGSHTRIVLMQNFSWGEVVEFFPLRELKSSMRTIRCTQDVRVVHSAKHSSQPGLRGPVFFRLDLASSA